MYEKPNASAALWQEFHAQAGRIALCLRLLPLGRDLHACLVGGEAHVGATALAVPGEITQASERPRHREGALAARTAERLSVALGCAVSVSCGIHYAGISREEIATVERLADELVNSCLASLRPRSNEPC